MSLSALLMPGEFLAKRADKNYAKLARQVRSRSLWLAWVGPFTEYALAPALGLISGLLLVETTKFIFRVMRVW